QIGRAHAATALASHDDVVAARVSVPPPPIAQAGVELPVLGPAAVPQPVETVILRRGSTRRFPREPITLPQLGTLLHAARAAVEPDCPGTAEPSLIVHAVGALDPGAYVVDTRRTGVVPLRHGRFRDEAGWLGLGQELPADAAVNIYWLVDLDAVL